MTATTTLDQLAVVKGLAQSKSIDRVAAANPHLPREQVDLIARAAGYPRLATLQETVRRLEALVRREKSGPMTIDGVPVGTMPRNDVVVGPTKEKPTPAGRVAEVIKTSTPPATVDATRLLLDKAKASSARSTVRLAERIEGLLSSLQTSLRLEEQARIRTAQAAEERKRIQAEIEETEQRLRELRAKVGQTPKTRRPHGGISAGTAEAARAAHERVRNLGGLTTIRTWAIEHGYTVGERGMLPREVVDAYEAALPTKAQAAS